MKLFEAFVVVFFLASETVFSNSVPESSLLGDPNFDELSAASPQNCPSGQLWYPPAGACISECIQGQVRIAQANWGSCDLGLSGGCYGFGCDGWSLGCYESITSPPGTTIEINVQSFSTSVCDASCNVTALQISDNYGPFSNPLCCSTDVPKLFAFNSNNVIMAVLTKGGAIKCNYAYRYVNSTTSQTTTTLLPTTSFSTTTAAVPITSTTTAVTSTITTSPTPNSCATGEIYSAHANQCIKQCDRPMITVKDYLTEERINFGAPSYVPSLYCYVPLLAPVGTRIQYTFPLLDHSECSASCVNTSIEVSDNFQPPSNAVCCSGDLPSLYGTTTSNQLLLILFANSGLYIRFVIGYRYIGTPIPTTVPPPGTCPIPGQISFRDSCVGPCERSYEATASWITTGTGFASSGCFLLFTSPQGTNIQLNITNIAYSTCNAGCTTMGVAFSDNLQPPSGPAYCCPSDTPSFTSTTNKAALTGNGYFSFDIAYRFTGTPTMTTTTTTTTSTKVPTTPTTTKVTTKSTPKITTTTKKPTTTTKKPTTTTKKPTTTTKKPTTTTKKPTTKPTTKKPTTKATTKKPTGKK